RAIRSRGDEHRWAHREDVMLQSTDLPRAVDHANRRWIARFFEAANTSQICHFLDLDQHIVFRRTCWTLHADENLPGCSAADADVQPTGADDVEVSGSKPRAIAADQLVEIFHAPNNRVRGDLVHRLHQALSPCEILCARPRCLSA